MTAIIHVSEKELKIVQRLVEKHLPDIDAWVYGDRLNGESNPKSDLYIVVFTTPEQQQKVGDLREAFDESDLSFRVNLSVWDALSEASRKQAVRESVVLQGYTNHKHSKVSEGVQVKSIGDVCLQITSGGTPRRNINSYYENGTWPWIKTKELQDGFVQDTEEYITDEALTSSSAKILPENTVLMAMYGATVGQLGILQRPMSCNQACCAMIVDPSQADFRYLFYRLLNARTNIKKLATGAAQQNISGKLIRSLKFPFPFLSEQRAISHILGTLDDKIELNRRMNATLEAMARALFKSWFVDFDPVRGRMVGIDMGLPRDILDLFPDRLVDFEFGEVPNGWTVRALDDIATSRMRGIDPAHVTRDTPYIGLQHMPRRSVALIDWGAAGSVSSRKSAFKVGDILFGKLRPYFHKVGIAAVDGICSTDIVVLNARKPNWSAFVLACVSSADFVAHTSQTSTGTKMPRTSWQAMSTYELCMPTDAIASEFQRVVSPMLEQIVRNVHESRTLAVLRDTLLPKLVSGELRVNQSKMKTL